MKFQVLCLIVLVAFATADHSMLNSEAAMKARAGDAVDSALDVLKGLKQANVDAQKAANKLNKTKEAQMKLEIQELLDLADTNKQSAQKETDNVKFMKKQIIKTNARLKWIVARRKELKRKRSELQDQRCAASMAFVKALKEHMEAIKVVAYLKADVKNVINKKKGKSFGQVGEVNYSMLGQYAHLFNEKAMHEFAELSGTTTRKKFKLKKGKYANKSKSRIQRFMDMVSNLEKHLKRSIRELKKNEIKAAYDLVGWLSNSAKELVFLKSDQKAKINYIDKLTINIVGAKAREERLWTIYFESASTYNDAVAKRVTIRKTYMEEKARRLEENIVLDGIIQMFIKQVAKLNKRLRAGVDDHQDDGKINKSKGDWTKKNKSFFVQRGTRQTLDEINAML